MTKHSHYFKPVAGLESIDVYRVLSLFGITDPCIQHACKKLLATGKRGHKNTDHDIQDAIDTLERWKAMRQEDEQAALLATGKPAMADGFGQINMTISLREGVLEPRPYQSSGLAAKVLGDLYHLLAADVSSSDIPAGDQQIKEPQRPRHVCPACAGGHSLAQCNPEPKSGVDQ